MAACATAFALALAGLTAPLAANAARGAAAAEHKIAPKSSTTSSLSTAAAAQHQEKTGHIFSSLLEKDAREKVEAFEKTSIRKLREAVQAVDTNINKTWMPQDIWQEDGPSHPGPIVYSHHHNCAP